MQPRWGVRVSIGVKAAATFLLCSFAVAHAFGQVQGLWRVDYPGEPSGATQGIWQSSKLRFNSDGTFKQYGGLGFSGRYKVSGPKVHLTIERMFYQEIGFGAPALLASAADLAKGWTLQIQRKDLLVNETFPAKSKQTTVVWRPAEREPVRILLYKLAKVESQEQSNEIGDYVFDEISERRSEAIPILIGMLKDDKDREDCYWCAALLGHLRAKQAVPQLIIALCDPRRWMPNAAARALGEIGSGDAVPALIAALKEGRISDYTAAQAFEKIGDRRAVPVLAERLATSKSRGYIIVPLARLGDPSALPALRALESSTDEKVRANLPAAIRLLDPSDPYPAKALPDLIQIARKGEWLNQMDAIEALGILRDHTAVPTLVGLLSHANFTVRRDAVNALGEIGAKEALREIRKLLNDDDEQVRLAARKAVARLS